MAHINYKRHRETYRDGVHEYHFIAVCTRCRKEQPEVTVKGPDLHRYHNMEGHLQDLFSYLTPGQRELLFQSGMCDTCWDEIFSDEDE